MSALWYPFCSNKCVHCQGDGPEQFEIEPSGITENGCGDCIDFNSATYTVDRDVYTPPAGCHWRYTFGTALCNVKYIDLYIVFDDAVPEYTVQVIFRQSGGGTLAAWGKTISGSLPNCSDFYGLTLDGGAIDAWFVCDGLAPATVVVTAV